MLRGRRKAANPKYGYVVLAKVQHSVPGHASGVRHREYPKPVAALWRQGASQRDLRKARRYAGRLGYSVFTFPKTERDPLGKARAAIKARGA